MVIRRIACEQHARVGDDGARVFEHGALEHVEQVHIVGDPEPEFVGVEGNRLVEPVEVETEVAKAADLERARHPDATDIVSLHVGHRVFLRVSMVAFRNSPIPSIQLMSSWPGCRNTGGVRNIPTPSGVPVKMRSPGNSGHTTDNRAIRSGTLKMSSRVVERCITSPSRAQPSSRLSGSASSSGVTTHGPSGPNAGHDLPIENCGAIPSNCSVRSVMS